MNFLTTLSSGIGTMVVSIATAAYNGFEALFLDITPATESAAASVALNPLGDFAVALLIYRVAAKFIPMIAGWFQLRGKSLGTGGGKKRRRA